MDNWSSKSTRNKIEKPKYLKIGSTHTNAIFNAITSGILNRIARLTSRTNKNAQMRVDKNTKNTPML